MGSTKNRAADEANRIEQDRQASIGRTQSAVNAVFNDPKREGDIADYIAAMRGLGTQDLDRQKKETDRNLRFALARGGLIGGSTQIDQAREFGETYGRGKLDIERRAQGAGAELRAADQDARGRLISLATSGLDATTAAQQAGAAMRSNIEAGRATGLAAGMGDVFSRFNKFIDKSEEASVRRRISRETAPLYQPAGYGG